MLNAILEGKAGRIMLNEEVPQSWRTVFQSYEDLLTAAIWSRINYLSPAAMEHFFSALLGINGESWGAFESITFWPKYVFPNPVDENMKLYFSGQERFAEPDVVITFEHIALIVEVKPPAGGMQYQQQWRKELYTYLHDDDAKNTVHFLALGNLPRTAANWFIELKAEFPQVDFHGMEWHKLREIFQHSEWEAPQDKRIIADCLKALTLYGIRASQLPWQRFHQFLADTPLPSEYSF
ncbi:hypothetical protein [Hafnia paralvei]|uniref:hypothetical protein n=1 Tax=Hafnia paralvei TaxID=546367 RepID=UPI001F3841E9|nr:hypothetical protein [Hafnia paralvei]MCE9949310.1 hypothetical protein [Hafnia paralvei]